MISHCCFFHAKTAFLVTDLSAKSRIPEWFCQRKW